MRTPKIPEIKKDEFSPTVIELLDVLRYQAEQIQILRNEIAVLKGDKKPPKIKPGNLDKGGGKNNTDSDTPKKDGDKRNGSAKRNKTENLKIHSTVKCPAHDVPAGSIFKGYKEFTVQGIVIKPHNTLYRIERWQTVDGTYIQGKLPESVTGHFSSELISFIQYQYHQCHVTAPLLLEELLEFKIDISIGQINNILVEGNELFHEEKDELLKTGLANSSHINVDDTGARHDGKNGYCTQIGNEFFTWFGSTHSKSRINFLTLLQAGNIGWCLNDDAFNYFKREKLPLVVIELLRNNVRTFFITQENWQVHLKSLGIKSTHHVRIATEGALIGNLFKNDFNPSLVILSDDAGQFNILLHALCWVHAERLIHKLVPYTDEQRASLKLVLDQIWEFYRELKDYKINPTTELKKTLDEKFDSIFLQNTCYLTLNIALKRLYKNKNELLLVLDRPEIPLHNNLSETDIREYVKRRKISGGTRSDSGQKSRDTFTSLKKTARKLGVSFWDFLNDRNSRKKLIPTLSELMILGMNAQNTC